LLIDEASGAEVIGHAVCLDATDWQFEAFRGLHHYLAWHVAPDRRGTDEARIVAEVGEWISARVLGPVTDVLVRQARRRHVIVRVVVPGAAGELLLAPLELARADERPLAVQGVTFVMQSGLDEPDPDARAARERLHILGLFSLPEGGRPLNLRRERQALVTLIQGIADAGKGVDVRVLQYGVTRELLRDVLADSRGWDIIHISGHGAPGELLLETADGKPDRVTAATLADLLMAAREHVRLITVASCWSAALTVADQRRRLGLPVADLRNQDHLPERTPPPVAAPPLSGTLATELADRLDCAVLAMRYPVDDEFVIALSTTLYDLLADKGNPLPQAVAMTLRQLSQRAFPALSLATPALFGRAAVGLSLAASERGGPAECKTGRLKLPGFPPQPERFVGRTAVMARASAALALRSGVPGVLLHGMPGGGKTACALELAYGHEHAFDRLVWYRAPDQGMSIDGALTDFAFTLEQDLPGFQMLDVLVDPAKLTGFLPRLTELVEQHRVLLTIDNVESLLTEDGEWRDSRWGEVIGVLTAHRGLGRVILTSRRVPVDLTGLRVEAVDALSADEALLLARELPHLQALSRGRIPGVERHVARRLARRALEVAQGHPKLLELADGQVAHPDQLATLVKAGDQEWRKHGGLPTGFFTAGETTATANDFWHVLVAWTKSVAGTLSPGERDLFWFLCCLEGDDRERGVLQANWDALWNRLNQDGLPPDLAQALSSIAGRGLVAIREKTNEADESYAVHPGVAEAGRAQAGTPFQDAVDTEAAAFWTAIYERASGETGDGTVHTGLEVRAGLAAVPYLLRKDQWTQAATLLERAFLRDPSRGRAAAVLPAIKRITRHEPRKVGLLARVLRVIDPAAAEARLRAGLEAAATAGDYRDASMLAGRLVNLYLDAGRLAEALILTRQKADYTCQAGLGPWTQFADNVQELQVRSLMGQAAHVLAEIHSLRAHMDTLPAIAGSDEAIPPWNVRESLLSTGFDAAQRLGRWGEAFDLNAAQVASMRDRRAPAAIVAEARFNGYVPLLRLGRAGEALDLLLDCRQVFTDAHDTRMLGRVISALADTEDKRGHRDAAIRLETDAFRYKYLTGDVTGIAVSYNNLGNHVSRNAHRPATALASHLAAALIHTLTGTGLKEDSVSAAATDLRVFGTDAVPPTDIANLCDLLGDIPGTDLARLIQGLCPDPETSEATLRDLIAQAVAIAAQPAPTSPDDDRG